MERYKNVEKLEDLIRRAQEEAWESLPEEDKALLEKEDRHRDAILSALYRPGDAQSRCFCILRLISDEAGQYDPAGVSALAWLLARIHEEKEELRGRLEKARWFASHMMQEFR